MEDACKSKTFFLEKLSDGTIRPKRNHDYYIQVQGQLYVATDLNIESIHVIVYFGEEMPLFKGKIFMESLHWNQELLPRLEFFFKRALYPEMLTKRVERGKLFLPLQFPYHRWTPNRRPQGSGKTRFSTLCIYLDLALPCSYGTIRLIRRLYPGRYWYFPFELPQRQLYRQKIST